MKCLLSVIVVALAVTARAGGKGSATTQPIRGPEALKKVRAVLAADRRQVRTSERVWVDFLLHNTSDRPVTLAVPDTKEAPVKNPVMGLPLEHVFSGEKFRALSVTDGRGKESGREVMLRPVGKAPTITLGPKAVVGMRVDVTEYYPSLRRSGLYVLQWHPYGGAIASNTLRIELKPHKEVVITTNLGKLRLRLLYDKAPNHVANFLELIEKGFYNRTKFFRLYTGVAVMGGDRNNDGSGMRKDGKTVKAEFNDTPFDQGTVAMSLAGDDPDSASCQFFICLRRIKQWDGKYTAFAQVIGVESLETLGKIGGTAVDNHDRPLQDIVIERMDVETIRNTGSREMIIRRR